jgi:hypothetical protein
LSIHLYTSRLKGPRLLESNVGCIGKRRVRALLLVLFRASIVAIPLQLILFFPAREEVL